MGLLIDQALNTTDSPTFAELTVNEGITVPVAINGVGGIIDFGGNGHLGSRYDGALTWNKGATEYVAIREEGFSVRSTGYFGFCSGSIPTATPDTSLYREDAGVIAQRYGSSPQGYLLYNTYSGASNYERGVFKWDTNRSSPSGPRH